MGLTASGVTRTLLPLEKIGLVGRESDPRDARSACDADSGGAGAARLRAGVGRGDLPGGDAGGVGRAAIAVLEVLGQLAGINLSIT